MSQIPTPPPSRGVSVSPNDECKSTAATLDDKVQLLDELLERYLNLLDRHQKLQESLGKQLSLGFFQLAHANYCSPGRRFGEDFYDERMKATRRLNITSSSTDKEDHSRVDTQQEKVHFKVNYESVLVPEDNKEEGKEKDDEDETNGEKDNDVLNETEKDDNQELDVSTTPPTPPQTTQDTGVDNEDVDSTKNDNDTGNKKKPIRKLFRSDDPISWYGILVPPSLKNAQKSFTEAVEGGIPELVTVAREMQYVETFVYELRQQIKTAA